MKKIIFYILSGSITFIILYFVFFIYFFLTLEKDFKYNFKSIEDLNFYKQYSKKVNHLRFRPKFKLNSKQEQLFTVLNNSNSSKTILFQGDSWIQGMLKKPKAKDYLIEFVNNDAKLVNAGITSYAPSLINAQYSILEKDFNIKPEILFIYIDQTDIGDEFCRYKNLRVLNSKGNLEKVLYEEYPIFKGTFNIHEILVLSEIDLNYKSKIIKTQKYFNYKLIKSINRFKKQYHRIIKKDYYFEKCDSKKMESYFISPNHEANKHFENVLKDYFNKITNKKYLKKIFIITHPHKTHVSSNKYDMNVSNLVEYITKDFPKIKHINFTNIIKNNPNFYDEADEIWMSDQMHLVESSYYFFIKEILRVSNLKKLIN